MIGLDRAGLELVDTVSTPSGRVGHLCIPCGPCVGADDIVLGPPKRDALEVAIGSFGSNSQSRAEARV